MRKSIFLQKFTTQWQMHGMERIKKQIEVWVYLSIKKIAE